MGIANRVINILVLVAAIVVVIFGFMLFNKREQLVDGWGIMAKEINTTAKALDANSGTNVAADLTAQSLDHKKYDSIKSTAAKLNAAAQRVIEERDSLANSIVGIAEKLEVKSEDDAVELMKIATSASRQAAIAQKIDAVQRRNDYIVEQVVAIGSSVDASVSAADLKDNEKSRESLSTVSRQVNDVKQRKESFQSHIVKVADVLELQDKPSLAGDDYKDSLNNTFAGIQNFKNTFDTTKKDLENEKQKNNELVAQNTKQKSEIDAQLKTIAKQKKEIKRLNNIINPSAVEGSTQVVSDTLPQQSIIKKIEGKVVYVDSKFGFVTINIGSKNQVKHKIGNFEREVAAPISVGQIMTVAKDPNKISAVFAGKIKIMKVNEYGAIANILPLPAGAVAPQVGDTVFFMADDVQKVMAAKAAALKASDAAAKAAAKNGAANKDDEDIIAE